MKSIDVLLIYPQLGSFDDLVRDIPLSLIYAATDSVKNGYTVKILDLRLHPQDWQKEVDARLQEGVSLVGLSVMTGNPIRTSLEISKYIRERSPTPIVWGGPHPTILPQQTLENEYVDFVIRDWGSKPLFQLIRSVKNESEGIENILGLGYKKESQIKLNEPQCSFEILDYVYLPYHLIDINSSQYNRLNNGEVIFPIFTALGCPYQCSFCISPAVYKKIKGKKWIPLTIEYVIGHVEYLLKRYDFQRLQIYDDDSFVDLDRMYNLMQEYVRRGFHEKLILDFRGARINELDKMDDDYLRLMVKARVKLLAIGVESGSNRTLEKMKKGINVEQTIRVNRKLARFPSLKPHYNFFCGIPGETLEDLIQTKELLIRLLKENPGAYLGVGADWKPLPGSAMTEMAVKEYGLRLPQNLMGWSAIDSFDARKIIHSWYTKEINNMIKLLQIAGQLLDRKVQDFRKVMGLFGCALYLLRILYYPILKARLKYNFTSFLIEHNLKKWFFIAFIKFQGLKRRLKKTSS